MSCCARNRIDLCIVRGATFHRLLRWGGEPIVYRPIQLVENSAPLRIHCAGHGLPDGWPFAVSGVRGMLAVNAKSSPPDIDSDFVEASVLDADTIEVNRINGTLDRPYRGGGTIQYFTPSSLAGMSASMSVLSGNGTSLLEIGTDSGHIVLDPFAFSISIRIPPDETAAIEWKAGRYALKAFNGNDVYQVAYGEIIAKD